MHSGHHHGEGLWLKESYRIKKIPFTILAYVQKNGLYSLIKQEAQQRFPLTGIHNIVI